MDSAKEYKCPCCGGSLNFDSSSQKIKCPYCDSEFDASVFKELDNDLAKDISDEDHYDEIDHEMFSEEEAKGLTVYTCESCGGEIVCDENTAATSCPYCDSPVLIRSRLAGGMKPEYIIPFGTQKEQVVTNLVQYCKGKLFLPRAFRKERKVEDIKGIYAPYWLFDSDCNGYANFEGTKERRFTRGDDEIIETSYYRIERAGSLSFDKIPVDGSKKLDDALMESIEPYSFKEKAKPFLGTYLTGYMADKYDVSMDDTKVRAKQRMRDGTVNALRGTIHEHYNTITLKDSKVSMTRCQDHYAMYPVWITNVSWKEKRYTFAMNGDTGKTSGNLPLSKLAYALWFIGFVLVLSGVTVGLDFLWVGTDSEHFMGFMGLLAVGIILSFVIAFVFCNHHKKKLKGAVFKNGAADYVVPGSLDISNARDIYLYTKRRVIHHQSNNNNGRGRR